MPFGDGIHFLCAPTGGRYWRYRYRFAEADAPGKAPATAFTAFLGIPAPGNPPEPARAAAEGLNRRHEPDRWAVLGELTATELTPAVPRALSHRYLTTVNTTRSAPILHHLSLLPSTQRHYDDPLHPLSRLARIRAARYLLQFQGSARKAPRSTPHRLLSARSSDPSGHLAATGMFDSELFVIPCPLTNAMARKTRPLVHDWRHRRLIIEQLPVLSCC